jgi:hypothetical protein
MVKLNSYVAHGTKAPVDPDVPHQQKNQVDAHHDIRSKQPQRNMQYATNMEINTQDCRRISWSRTS